MRCGNIVQPRPEDQAPADQPCVRDHGEAAPAESGGGASPLRMARRIGVAIVGSVVLAVGVVLLVTPGPAFVVIPIGLGILSLEFEWARRWLDRVKQHVRKVMPHGKDRDQERSGSQQA